MTRYRVYSESGEGRVKLQIKNYAIFVDNPREGAHLREVTEHHVNAVLEEIVMQSKIEGLRVSEGQILVFSKYSHHGRCSGTPMVGMPCRKEVEKAFIAAGYQKKK